MFQGRWLDSGEMDERVYDYNSGLFVPNAGRAINGRTNGAIQEIETQSAAKGDRFLALQVLITRFPPNDRFLMPYLSSRALWVINEVIEWQKEYGPPPFSTTDNCEQIWPSPAIEI